MNWTDERVDLLKKLWGEGLSASVIAAQIGGISRNAVIGKVHRLKLSGRGRANAAPARPKKSAAAQPVAAAATAKSSPRSTTVVRPVAVTVGATALQAQFETEPVARQQIVAREDVVIPISRRLKLVQLSERTCKWPNGDPMQEDFHFCGNDCADSGPYCTYHSRIAYQPVAERRRQR